MSFIHVIGYGGQGKAIAPSLIEAGFDVAVYLRELSPSIELCKLTNIPTRNIESLSANLKPNDRIIFACPDRIIGAVYRKYIQNASLPIHHILLHGFAMWSKDLVNTNSHHTFNLCAPKAIGPELREAITEANTAASTHSLKAAIFCQTDSSHKLVHHFATKGLNFAPENLIPATFVQETVGDLISEQLLLCGGVFSLLEWTMQEMRSAGIPEALIHEECITELKLIANVLQKRGLEGTVAAISDSAKAGAAMMREKFIAHKLPELLHEQAAEVQNGIFLSKLKNETEWKSSLSKAFKDVQT